MRPLLWVSKSMDKLAAILTAMGHPISADTVRKELVKLGFSRQYTCKAEEGSKKHPDRNAQFDHINAKVVTAQAKVSPSSRSIRRRRSWLATSEMVAPTIGRRAIRCASTCTTSRTSDLGKVVPYGVYDVTANAGFVSVGITSDTAQFAVQSIRTWLARMGRERYPDMKELTITADCGGVEWRARTRGRSNCRSSPMRRSPTLSVHHLSAGNVEVEQDRAPPVLPYHAELARPASDGSYRSRRTHRRDDDKGGPQGRMRARRANL